jgi:OmpA-OmpF porin, OOP family
MKKITVIVMMVLFGMMSTNLCAAQKDAAGCKDHPLIPRMPGYYITGCSNDPANSDVDIVKGNTTETIHLEGKSMALLYSLQPELKTKTSEAQLRGDFENTVKKQGGTQIGITYGQKWPVYKIVRDGKEFWVVLMVNSGEYYTGSYAYRIIEK